ncbi:probable ribosome-binding factor A, chloroplastic [Olea europaea subsp. europaea]|uniref:Probable ribosome-binding factor A, chloroplastic n=1 Tax=Olea europaea subsp. europaea TaxID=158383 RepID=A0A8S0TX31_OLEEU|nr:probable ribosome-binding factor A, chloroplastic [Olea europaea subsp. europaea]
MSNLFIHNPIITKSCSIPTSRRSTPWIYPIAFMPLLRPPHRIIFPSTCYGRNSIIKCMANPRRVKMVAKQIRRELSDMLLTDKVLQYAVLPEAALGADRYLSSLTTISDVEVSADLQVVKVYVSVFGDERGKEVALAGLKSKAKYVRSKLGKRMKLRLTPEIRFIEDESLERGSRVLAILDSIKDENDKKATEGQAEDLQDSSSLSNDEWEGDDPDDEGIIYVE